MLLAGGAAFERELAVCSSRSTLGSAQREALITPSGPTRSATSYSLLLVIRVSQLERERERM